MKKVDGKKLLEEVKSNDAARKAEEKAGRKPWYIVAIIWLLDVLSAIGILALAIYGASRLISPTMDKWVIIGISALVVGLLASRMIERVFSVRR